MDTTRPVPIEQMSIARLGLALIRLSLRAAWRCALRVLCTGDCPVH